MGKAVDGQRFQKLKKKISWKVWSCTCIAFIAHAVIFSWIEKKMYSKIKCLFINFQRTSFHSLICWRLVIISTEKIEKTENT